MLIHHVHSYVYRGGVYCMCVYDVYKYIEAIRVLIGFILSERFNDDTVWILVW